MNLRSWLQLFRLPNLPTAPGDALAGAAFLFPSDGGGFAAAAAAGAAELAMYMFGLADNDIAGAPTDGPERPIARGDISLRAARVVRALCLVCVAGIGACAGLPSAWWIAAAALLCAIVAYNRARSKWLMGLCRGLGVASGALAVWPPAWGGGEKFVVASLAAGWTLYVAAVTWLSEGEERDSDGLGRCRYAWGLMAFAPLAACAFLPDPRCALLPAIGSIFACMAWCAAVAPLGDPHGPAERRRAVGRTIGALLYLQIGFMLTEPRREFLAAALALWVAARIARRLAPSISGS